MPKNKRPKIFVVLGPTASGKSSLAIELAKKLDGEVISADSRQVYTGLNLGTGKVTQKEMLGIPHHLLNVVSPKKQFTVINFKTLAEKAIVEILARGKTPIICGGTGFYIQALVDNLILPEVAANLALRKKLEKKSTQQLFAILQKLDPTRAKNIDAHNPRRLIRSIEIATALGKVPQISTLLHLDIECPSGYDFVQIGIKISDEQLRENIEKRLLARIKKGMIAEAKKLHTEGLSWKRMDSLGLEYRYLAKFCLGKISRSELISTLNSEIWHYAKRQMTWFKRDRRIKWLTPTETKRFARN